MSRGRRVRKGLHSPSHEIVSRSSPDLSSARQRNTAGSADIIGMTNRSAIDWSAADMTGFHPYQPEEGHGEPNTSYQGQELNPSQIYDPMLRQSSSATEVSMPYYMTDPLEGMLEYDPDFSFPTPLEDDNWNPEDFELGNRSNNSQEGVDPGFRGALEDQEFESHLYSLNNQELGTDISTSRVRGRYRSRPNEIPAIHQHTHSDARAKNIPRARRTAASSEKGLNGKASKNNIRFRPDKTMEWLDGHIWVKAVYHNDIRAELIAETENLGVYIYPRAHGAHPLDITSFCLSQISWGPERSHWAAMPHKLLFRLECNDFPTPNYKVEKMMHEDRVVLDNDNRPIKDYRDIPKTLSSNMEAYLMENISRLDSRITRLDFLARMPKTRGTTKGPRTLPGPGFLAQRIRRFRVKNAIVSWKGRDFNSRFVEYIKGLLSEEGLRNNSTEELGCLSELQQEEIFELDRGKFLARAGKNALTSEERNKRAKAHERRILRLKKREAEKSVISSPTNQGGKRKRTDIEVIEPHDLVASSDTRLASTQKMPPNSQSVEFLDSQWNPRESSQAFEASMEEPSGVAAALDAQGDEPPQKRQKLQASSPFSASFLDEDGAGSPFQNSSRSRDDTPLEESFRGSPNFAIDPFLVALYNTQEVANTRDETENSHIGNFSLMTPEDGIAQLLNTADESSSGQDDVATAGAPQLSEGHQEFTEDSTNTESQMQDNAFMSEEDFQTLLDYCRSEHEERDGPGFS